MLLYFDFCLLPSEYIIHEVILGDLSALVDFQSFVHYCAQIMKWSQVVGPYDWNRAFFALWSI